VERVAQESFDLVFMDVQMPVMDGLEAAAAIRRLPDRQSLPILAMTANAFSEDRELCLAAGMNDHLAKPIELDKLQTLLLLWLPLRPQSAAEGGNGQAGSEASSGIDLLRCLDGMDTEAGLQLLQGDSEGYLRLLLQCTEHHGEDGQRLASLATTGDYPGLRQRAHALKGATATLGAWRIAELASEVEQMAASGSGTEILLNKIDILKQVIELLCRQITEAATPAVTTVAPSRYNPEQINEVLTRMEQLLAIEDSVVNDLYLAHREMLAAAFTMQARHLGRLIDDFDYAEALSLVRNLLTAHDANTPSPPNMPPT